MGGNVGIRAKRIVVLSAVLLALCGCVPAAPAAPVTETPGSSGTVNATLTEPESPEKDRMAAIIQAAVEDRNSGILAAPPASKRLGDGESTAAFKEARVLEAAELATRAKRFKAKGFWYVGSSSTVTISSILVPLDHSYAVAHFNELTELRIASAAGPSDVPTKYSLDQTARFVATENGWQLSELGLDGGTKGILPSTIVAPR